MNSYMILESPNLGDKPSFKTIYRDILEHKSLRLMKRWNTKCGRKMHACI